MAGNLNLQVFRKTTKHYLLKFKKNGIARNITNWTIYFTVKEKMSDEDSAAKINHNITSHPDGINGKTLITLTQDDTNRVGEFWYDVTYKDDNDNVGVLFYGKILFTEKATQRA